MSFLYTDGTDKAHRVVLADLGITVPDVSLGSEDPFKIRSKCYTPGDKIVKPGVDMAACRPVQIILGTRNTGQIPLDEVDACTDKGDETVFRSKAILDAQR